MCAEGRETEGVEEGGRKGRAWKGDREWVEEGGSERACLEGRQSGGGGGGVRKGVVAVVEATITAVNASSKVLSATDVERWGTLHLCADQSPKAM